MYVSDILLLVDLVSGKDCTYVIPFDENTDSDWFEHKFELELIF